MPTIKDITPSQRKALIDLLSEDMELDFDPENIQIELWNDGGDVHKILSRWRDDHLEDTPL
jgi:hypothetical protein